MLQPQHVLLRGRVDRTDLYRSCLQSRLRARHLQQQSSVRLPLRMDWRYV